MTIEEQRSFILSGALYNDLTPELVKARENTVFLTNEYNASFGKPAAEREAILRKLLKSIGENVHFEPTFRCEFGYNITIGSHFYANFDCVLLDGGCIDIGDHVLFGPRVGIYTSNHATDAWERIHGACYAKPVKIGNNVGWRRRPYQSGRDHRRQYHYRLWQCCHKRHSGKCHCCRCPLQGYTRNNRC